METPPPAQRSNEERSGKAATKLFRKPAAATRLAPATEYLNGADQALGGRPLDIAMASEDGMTTVVAAISARATR